MNKTMENFAVTEYCGGDIQKKKLEKMESCKTSDNV
jgi:hypothetical protein